MLDRKEVLHAVQAVQKAAPWVEDWVVRAFLIRVPASWKQVEAAADGAAFLRGSVQVIAGVERYVEGGPIWIHVSALAHLGTRPRLPDYEELKRVKRDFFGDGWAYQVFAPESQHVNINACVLHLFGRLDGKPELPDFTRGAPTL